MRGPDPAPLCHPARERILCQSAALGRDRASRRALNRNRPQGQAPPFLLPAPPLSPLAPIRSSTVSCDPT